MGADLEVAADGRRVIRTDAPSHQPWLNLLPLRDALVERGNAVVSRLSPQTDFFNPTPDGYVCVLRDPITAADWAALQERFVIPPEIAMPLPGLIRDGASWTDVRGG